MENILAGLLPLVGVLPGGYSLLVRSFTDEQKWGHSPIDQRVPLIGYSVQYVFLILVYLNPLFDALTTLFVVKAYRKALLHMFGFKSAHSTTTTGAGVDITRQVRFKNTKIAWK